ncbi:hypothetical protein pb186bvf_011056 [Paramecium bursaria]
MNKLQQKLNFNILFLVYSLNLLLIMRIILENSRNHVKRKFCDSQLKIQVLGESFSLKLNQRKKQKMLAHIQLCVKCYTYPHQQVYIAGNIKELGNWDANQSIRLTTTDSIYPMWIGQISLEIEQDSLVEFKLLIRSNNETIWENIENRVIQIKYSMCKLLLQYNTSYINMLRIKPFFDACDDIKIEGLQKRKLRKFVSPLDADDASSQDSDSESDILSLFQSQGFSVKSLEDPEDIFDTVDSLMIEI